jgi:DCN1-like protein 1/2
MMSRQPVQPRQATIDAQFDELFAPEDRPSPPTPTDALGPSELVNLAEKLGISPDDQLMYAIAFRLKCQTPCAVTRLEWKAGFGQMGVDSLQRLKEALPALKRDVHATPQRFRDFYNFAFEWSRETAAIRSVSCEAACALWPMVFQGRPFPLLKEWLDFIQHHTGDRPVKRDVWRLTLDFSGEDLSKYSSESSWPSVMDDFVKWLQDQGKLPKQPAAASAQA